MKKLSYSNFIISPIVLMGFWLVMSGKFDMIHILMGVLCVGFVLAINYQLRRYRYFEDDADVLHQLRISRLIIYLPWLLYQIVKSGIQVAAIILSPRMPIQPQIMRFEVNLPNAQAKMILGNSITLTPGTLTVDINGDEFIVHAIVPESLDSLKDDTMPRQVSKLFTTETTAVVRKTEIITDPDRLE